MCRVQQGECSGRDPHDDDHDDRQLEHGEATMRAHRYKTFRVLTVATRASPASRPAGVRTSAVRRLPKGTTLTCRTSVLPGLAGQRSIEPQPDPTRPGWRGASAPPGW